VTDYASTGWDVLDTALRALADVTRAIGRHHWNLPTPCEEWTVAQVIQHAVGDQLAWAAVVSSGPPPAENPFMPSGEFAEAPLEIVSRSCLAAADAWQAVRPGSGEAHSPLPVGDLPVAVAVGACALDAAVHAWDLAMATGQQSPLGQAHAGTLLDAARQVVEPLRGFAYAPALPASEDDDEFAVLLKYLGRQPDWKAEG
jgi:uncharacterized protein (TIGR03086 family)